MIIKLHKNIVVYILLTLLRCSKEISGAPPDITFIINKGNASQIVPTCIAEGDVLETAITWIYPIVDSYEKLPTIVSNFVPERNIEYNCNFGKTKPCSNSWQIDGWQYSSFDALAFKSISDSRWENLPTYLTSNTTKEFITRVDIPTIFQIGFSIRGSKNAEIFVCEGWNPKTYPCYYINVGGADNKQSFLRKYKNGIPDKFSKNDTKLAKFKLDIGILAEDEWKTFTLSLHGNGTLILTENFSNTTMLNYTDANQLKPINFIIRSKNYSTLWKIHKNEYIYTTQKNVTKIGPKLNLYGSQLCISLYVSLCKYCKIQFFIFANGEKQIMAEFTNDKYDELTWEEIKLLKNNVYEDAIQLYVKTSTSDETKNGFWAIDDVRICTENEIKVTRLQLDLTFKEFETTHITCEALKFPMWRPNHHISSDTSGISADVSCNTSTSTSIKLYWKPASDDKTFQEFSVINYEGSDICKYDPTANDLQLINKQRHKSQGYVIGRTNEINIENLVPYTFYTISFWNILDGNKKLFEMSTLPTVVPTKEELPRVVNMKVTDTTNEISWDKPRCTETYGPLIYQIYIKNQNGNDTRYYVDTTTNYALTDLQPFTNYTLVITSARSLDNLNGTSSHNIKTTHNFTTQPGIAPRVNDLELYSIGKQSASLRFELPRNCRGITTLMQIRWCHPLFLAGCLSEIHNLTKCNLWDHKYCADVNALVMGQEYLFGVSIKNENSFAFGTEATVTGKAIETAPGKPGNITYKMVECNKVEDYCHLNISWTHPYEQKAPITMFDVVLNETSYNFVADTAKSIHEIVKIKEEKYQKIYHCMVKYIPYNTPYKISVRAVNDVYKGDFEFIVMQTENIAHYIDQTPEFIESTNETITFKLPNLDWRLNSGTLIIVAQDYDKSKEHIVDDIVKLEMFDNKYKLCNDFGNTWVAKTLTLSRTKSPLIVVGDESLSYIAQLEKNITNKLLKPNTEYCFTFALINQYKNSETLAVYHAKHLFTQRNSISEKQNDTSGDGINAAVYVVPLLFIIFIMGCAVWFGRRYFLRRHRDIRDGDHIYESMPFDDYIPNAVSNQTYDRLIHK